MIRRPPRSTQSRSSAASDVYKRQLAAAVRALPTTGWTGGFFGRRDAAMLTLAAAPLPWTALAGLRTTEVTVAAGVLHLPGGHRLPAAPDPVSYTHLTLPTIYSV